MYGFQGRLQSHVFTYLLVKVRERLNPIHNVRDRGQFLRSEKLQNVTGRGKGQLTLKLRDRCSFVLPDVPQRRRVAPIKSGPQVVHPELIQELERAF